MCSSSSSPKILSLYDFDISLAHDIYDHLSQQYNYSCVPQNDDNCSTSTHSSQLDKILQSMKISPAETCCRVNLISSSVNEVIQAMKDHFSSFENEIDLEANCYMNSFRKRTPKDSFTVQRHSTIEDLIVIRRRLEQDMNDLARCSIPPTNHSSNHKAFSLWDKRSEKGWPMSHRCVIVDRHCGEAVMRGANIFVKGILCTDAGITAGEEVAVYTDLKSSYSKSIPRGLLLEFYSGRCVFLGVGISTCKRSEYFAQSTGLGVIMKKIAGPSQPSLNGILVGKMMLQNLPSVIVAHALNPQQGDVVLDMCCAPGGKTSHVASLIHNNGLIIACDKGRKKMIAARDFFDSMGASCIVPLTVDSTKLLLSVDDIQCHKDPRRIVQEATTDINTGFLNIDGFYPCSFDRILLDPPCSALGLRPKLIIDMKSLPELMKHSEYQQKFISTAIPLLKVGGTMTYSTCTINASENEEMVKFILSEFPCMKLVPISSDLPGLPGLQGMGLSEQERSMVRRFDPTHSIDSIGFFVAKFHKIEH